jgi:hypothetical protein
MMKPLALSIVLLLATTTTSLASTDSTTQDEASAGLVTVRDLRHQPFPRRPVPRPQPVPQPVPRPRPVPQPVPSFAILDGPDVLAPVSFSGDESSFPIPTSSYDNDGFQNIAPVPIFTPVGPYIIFRDYDDDDDDDDEDCCSDNGKAKGDGSSCGSKSKGNVSSNCCSEGKAKGDNGSCQSGKGSTSSERESIEPSAVSAAHCSFSTTVVVAALLVLVLA